MVSKNKKETIGDKMKYEIAGELGLIDKVNELGWGGLTAKETGKIGGIITGRKRKNKEKKT
ncbi:small, acid-soluble spore protein, alpha/beta type [Clostridium sp. D2Q-14]|nr:small, acid-soluble spore protein, alpha/beta type [Anaeromonas gelatinilytica]MBS4534174.1 small, acid-soluble spore protein, alpha/beta type [Anaeromonas gelatinilytica]